MIPILMYPAAKVSFFGLAAVTLIFGTTTIATMLGAVFVARAGVDFIPVERVQRFGHAIAGATIVLCGAAIVFLGL